MVCSCVSCQQVKAMRYAKSPIDIFAQPDALFDHIYLDFISPIPLSESNHYYLPKIERFSTEPDAISTPDMTAETSAHALKHD
ncbi:uncharacterized protein NPIL_9451 [Nephila pilipes]|uniref:Uncharacterized protein n=1 Tax=Nephila pilipes TaxID=299642 RepID=A0A8X6U7W1_NEPPI|nr:uncharacterized protein NPIL_9451 [Nephila pilipes]